MRSVRGWPEPIVAIAATGCVVVALAGCSDDQQPQNVGTQSGAKTPPKPTDPAAYESYVSGGADDKGVKRASLGNDLDVDLLVRVAYAGGEVSPELRDVETQVGDEIEIEVTSDRAQDITVGGYPDASSDVDPDEPEDVDFTVKQGGRIKVTLDPSGATLVTFVAKG